MQQVQQQSAADINARLYVLLQHPAFNTEVRILCAAAGTCRAWREAVQQCSAGNTAVKICLGAPLSRMCSFARWLPKHAALVSSITITPPVRRFRWPKGNSLPWELHLEAAQQLLQQAMQLATSLPAAHNAAAAAGAQQQQQQRVSLPNISSVTMAGDAAMLCALPAHSLTRLDLQWLAYASIAPATSTALEQLSKLEQLRICAWFPEDTVHISCLASIAQLSRLTALELDLENVACEELPQLLSQTLPLRVLRLRSDEELPMLDLSRLTQLLNFSNGCEALHATFPPQLQQLELGYVRSTMQGEALMSLHQLRRLTFVVDSDEPERLLHLMQLPALQQLVLAYEEPEYAASTAVAWLQLPQLCELDIRCKYFYSRQQLVAVFDGVAACTNITKLQLPALYIAAEGHVHVPANEYVAACDKLAGLTTLKDLCISGFCHLVRGNALALTALTGLTRLVLKDAASAVGDLAATALAGSCTQLQHLDLADCDLSSMACLANVRHLTQLTELGLERNAGLTQQGLMLLTGLKRLKQLRVSTNAEVTDEVVEGFWVALRGQQ